MSEKTEQTNRQQLLSEMARMNNENKRLERLVDKYAVTNKRLETENKQYAETNKRQENTILAKNTELDNLRKNAHEQASVIQDSDDNIIALNNKRNTLEAEVAALRKQVENRDKSLSTLQAHCNELATQLEEEQNREIVVTISQPEKVAFRFISDSPYCG